MKRAVLILCCLALTTACQRKSNQPETMAEALSTPLALNKVIVGRPPEIISILAPLDLSFNEPVIPQHLSGMVLDRSPFEIKPTVPGRAQWLSQTLIRFLPEKPFAPGTSYSVVFRGKIAFGSRRNVDDFSFSFKTAEQEVVEFSGDFVPDTMGPNMVRFIGALRFAQPVDTRKIARELRCSSPSGGLDLHVSSSTENPTQVSIASKPLKRTTKGQMLTFTLPQSYTVEKGTWTKEILLPPANVFKVITHMDLTEPGSELAVYGFRFSDPIRTGQDLSGYIRVEPSVPFTVSIDKKFLKLRGNFVPGREYLVVISEGFPSAFGTRTSGEFTSLFSLNNLKPQIEWLSDGIFLPSSNSYKLQFRSVNIAKLRVEVTQIYENNVGFFVQSNMLHDLDKSTKRPEWEDEYYYGESYSFSDLQRVGKEVYKKEVSITSETNKWVRSELDLSSVFKGLRNTGFVVTLRFDSGDLCGKCTNNANEVTENHLYYSGEHYYANPCNGGYYYRNGAKSKLLIASDIGLTAKSARDGIHVYAVNVLTSRPVPGLVLGLYSYQNQLLQQVTTDGSGRALFARADLAHYIRGEHSSGLALLRMDHPLWEMSSFDIGGVDEGQSGINTFFYTERGVHRPGDTVQLCAIIRTDRRAPPADQMTSLKVLNSRQQVVFEEKQKCGVNGHLSFAIPTAASDPTGAYRAVLSFADKEFSHPLKIEMVKPNRLKVAIELPDTVVGRVDLDGKLQSKYLFGSPAAGLRARLRVDLSSASLSIPSLPDYTFSHPQRRFDRREEEIFDAELDNEGGRSIRFQPRSSDAPELILATVRAQVYEKGGSFTSQSKRTIIVPYRAFVGVKNVFGWQGAQTGQAYQVPIIAADHRGKLLPGRKLTIRWFVNRSYWWWDYDNRSRPDFRELKTTYKIGEFSLISGEKPMLQRLEIEDEGQHLIEITDEQSGHTSGFFFWASSWGGAEPEKQQKERSFLTIGTDKNMYYTGDKAQISCETPKEGLVIFSLEQGDRILRQEVKQITGGRTTFSVDITDDMVPNCYAVLSVIQPHGQTSNDLPLRLYGVKSLIIEDLSTRLPITLTAPKEIRPNQNFEVAVSSQSNRPASYTLAVVDEGLLDLTGFDTPDPWDFFFKKLRLGVLTRDNLEEVLGVLFPDVDRRFSIGGDEEMRRKRAGESDVQRFKPVALFQKPMTIRPGETQRIRFAMPNYVGSVRIMLVGSAGHSYVSKEETVPVRQPLMVLPTVPRIARPGDQFSVPVSVFVMDRSVTNVDLSIKVGGALQIVGADLTSLAFTSNGEKDHFFTVSVKDQIGSGTITVAARSGSHQATETIELPINAGNPFYIQPTDTIVRKGASVVLKPVKFGLDGTNAARISLTRFPDIQVHKRYKDLIHYPYGCVEQTVSAAFPQLYLGGILELAPQQKQMIVDNVNAAIDRLSRFQTSGGFAFWPLSSTYRGEADEWASNYVGHFLIEARAAGYHVPDPLFDHWLRSAQNAAKTVNRTNHRFQTYRLFLLSLAGKANQGAMNLVRENHLRDLDPLSRRLLAASYHLSGQKDAARQIDQGVNTEISTYREMAGTYGSGLRDRAMVAYLSFTMGDLPTASRTLHSVAKEFTSQGWYSTQEMAFALLAVSTVYGSSLPGGAVPFTMTTSGGKSERMTLKNYQMSIDVSDRWNKEITISTESDNPLFVTLFEEGIPVDDRIQTASNGIELTRNVYDDNGLPMTLEQIRQGDQFWIRYRVRSTTSENLTQLALSSLIPSGWEIINTRLEGAELPAWVQNYGANPGTYMDLRDDRVNWFFDLGGRGEANFFTKCNATFKGSYRLPPVTVEAMYSPDYSARIGGGAAVVK